MRRRRLVYRSAGIVAFLAVWELVARLQIIPPELFPSIPALVLSLIGLLRGQELWQSELASLSRTTSGLMIALALALALGGAASLCRPMFRALQLATDIGQTLPPPALVPLLIFLLGLGPPMFLTVITFAAFWPLYSAISTALSASEPVQIAVARTIGFSSAEIITRVRLPGALPRIFTGMRVATGFSLMATIASEMIAGSSGLGYMLFDQAFSLHIDGMYAVLLIIGLNGAVLNGVILLLRQAAVGWHISMVQLAKA